MYISRYSNTHGMEFSKILIEKFLCQKDNKNTELRKKVRTTDKGS